MKCATCNFANEASAKFCINCGTVLALDCESCQRRNSSTARFCAGCGSALSSSVALRLPGNTQTKTAKVPIDTRAAREGSRKLVSILFADLVDSTKLMEELDAEDATTRVHRLLTIMREAVAQYDGTVNKVQGDGIMAIFGAPRPQEDHAVRACCASLAMRSALQALGPGWPLVRIGAHTGEVVVRNVETDIAPQFDAMGLTVHVAARVENLAPEGGIAVSEATANAAGDQVEFEPLGLHRVKGLSQSLALFTPRRIRSLVASEQFRGGQTLASFVGRDAEMNVLERALSNAAEGQGCCVALEGEPGQGKSRLVFEFSERCRGRDLPVIEARATALGRVAPHHIALTLLRAFVGIESDTPLAEAAVQAAAKLTQFGITEALEINLLLDFMGLPFSQAVANAGIGPSADAMIRRARLLALIARLAHTVGQSHAVIVIEDLHWLDPSSEAFLEALVETLPGSSALLVCSFRPGYLGTWLDREACQRLILPPLDIPALAALVTERLVSYPALRSHRDLIVAKATGNPFFAEELVRELVGRPEGRIGDLPNSVRGAIEARLDRLRERDRDFLQAAAVVGRDFDVDLVREITGLSIRAAQASMRRLIRREMVYERVSRNGGLAFKHPLVQEVAYNTMLRPSRAELHRRCATSLSVAAAKDEAQSPLMAYHWEQGGEPAQAAAGYVKSALWAAPHAPAHALEYWRAVRRLLDDQPPTTQSNYMRMLACGQIVNLAWREGLEASEVTEAYGEATNLARELQDTRALVLITLAYGRFLAAGGSADDYLAHTEQAMAVPEAMSNQSLGALLIAIHSHALMMAGYVDKALAANEVALANVHAISSRELQTLGYNVRHWLMALRARLLLASDRLPETGALLERLLGDPSEKVDVLHRMMSLAVAAELATAEGRLDELRRHVIAMEGIAREAPTAYLRVLALSHRALVSLQTFDIDNALVGFEQALTLARTQRAGLEREAHILLGLAEAESHRDLVKARILLCEARAVARMRSIRLVEGLVVAAQLRMEPRSVVLQTQFESLLVATGAGRAFLLRAGAST